MVNKDNVVKIKNKKMSYYMLDFFLPEQFSIIKSLLDKGDRETYCYCLVKMVTFLELFFRDIIRRLIDFGSPYRDNISKIDNVKDFKDINFINAIVTNQLTIGLIVANVVKMSSVEHIYSCMDKLLGEDFKSMIEKEEYKPVDQKSGLIMLNNGLIYSHISDIFLYRNKFVHEVLQEKDYEQIIKNIKDWYKSFEVFVDATNHLINGKISPEYYMTQTELNEFTSRKYEEIICKIDECINQICSKRLEFGENFQKTNLLWKDYIIEYAKIVASRYEGGTAYPYIFNNKLIDLATDRLIYLQSVLEDITAFNKFQ